MPLVKQGEEYMVANHSKFPGKEKGEFLSVTRVMVALNKAGRYYLMKKNRREARQLREEIVNSMHNTIAARSNLGQRKSCFCLTILIDGDNQPPLHLFVSATG